MARRVSVRTFYATAKDGKMPTYSLSAATLGDLRAFRNEVVELFSVLDGAGA